MKKETRMTQTKTERTVRASRKVSRGGVVAKKSQRHPRSDKSEKKTTAGGRKTRPYIDADCSVDASGKKTRPYRRKKSEESEEWRLPLWAKYVMMGTASAVLVVCFWYFFIQPYAYRWLPCYGTKAYDVCLPYGYEVHGFDISHHQGKIDWEQLRKTQNAPFPVRFVFMKASEGGDFSDSAFEENFSKAKEYGFIRGAYHFYNPKRDPSSQADFFIRKVNLEPGDLPPVLDIEKRGEDDETLRKNIKIWLKKVERHYGVKPILYTSYKFKERYLNDSVLNSYPYWIAHYYVDSVKYKGQWTFWQHTDIGRLPGIEGRVDLNVFNGSMEELEKLRTKN